VIFWVAGLSGLMCLVLLFLDGRRRERQVWQDWELVLTPQGEHTYQAMASRFHDEIALAEVGLGRATALARIGSTQEAIDLLEAGCRSIQRFAPDMDRALTSMATFSRMVAAMAPVSPLRPRDFRLTRLVWWAQIEWLVHHFLVTAPERFRLRLFVLRRGVGAALRRLQDVRGRIATDREAWDVVELLREDLKRLSDASLDSFRLLLASASAQRRRGLAVALPSDWDV
jgi:hypothetical protein